MGKRLERVEAQLDARQLGGCVGGLGAAAFRVRDTNRSRAVIHSGKDRLEPVIVGLGNRVELVVVALAAVDGKPRKAVPVAVMMSSRSSTRCCRIPSTVWLPTISCVPPTKKPVAACVSQDALFQRVAGKLFEHEAGKRRIAIEGIDDVVAIGPGIHSRHVGFIAFALAEADHVEPVPAPPLAIVGRGQQPVDQLLVGRGAGSFTNCSTSSGEGGKPSKSKLRRRIKVRRSASGAGPGLAP